ncbi:MAG: sulfatase-like hydrolase/transferase [Candidatus Hydrogenedentes bacterium]|nr:sulfatase-like hydrolase/transferase [Candidatus Hydrogenedentota bacterium]
MMNRRDFLTASATALAAAGAPLTLRAENQAMPIQDKPNILLIHTDQHRWDCLGACGHPDVRTPNIDQLAREGVRFDNHFCPYPVCTPSRYSLLSGQFVHGHQGWSNYCTLAPEIPTFPRALRDAGYATKAVGKMHFTPTYLDVGFQDLVLAEQDGPGRWEDDYHRALMAEGLVDRNDLEDQRKEYRDQAPEAYWESFGALPSNLPEEFHSTRWIADRAVETLEGWEGGGHLLMTGFIKPHHPFDPPASWKDAYDPDKLTLTAGWIPECLPRDLAMNPGYFPHKKLNEPALRRAMAYYYATISHIDAEVGRMLDVLRRKGLYDKTLIIFTSDHGEYLGFHHLLLKGNYMYDPLVRVPLIIRYPGAHGAGTVNGSLVSNIDVAPTILGLAGVAAPESMGGIDLRPGDTGREVLFAENRQGQHVMARSKTHKLILTDGELPALFFDLAADPLEMTDLYGSREHQDVQEKLAAAIRGWRAPSDSQRPYLDTDAPQIPVPHRAAQGNEKAVSAYYREKMTD